MDVRRLLKVYNYVNDEKKPKVNVKFAGAIVAFLVAGLGLLALALSMDSGAPPSQPPPHSTQDAYVGLSPSEIAEGGNVAGLADARLAQWRLDHPTYEVVSQESVTVAGVVVGYNLTYRAATPGS